MIWSAERVERLRPFLAAALDESLGADYRNRVHRELVLRASIERLIDSDGKYGFRPQTLLRALELAVTEGVPV